MDFMSCVFIDACSIFVLIVFIKHMLLVHILIVTTSQSAHNICFCTVDKSAQAVI